MERGSTFQNRNASDEENLASNIALTFEKQVLRDVFHDKKKDWRTDFEGPRSSRKDRSETEKKKRIGLGDSSIRARVRARGKSMFSRIGSISFRFSG